jgi:hypothetical protein
MVWGMRLPDNFGEFWPSGVFEYDAEKKESGWWDRLQDYYLAQTPEEQLRLFDHGDAHRALNYPYYVTGKFIYGIGVKEPGPDKPIFNAAESHEAPLTFDTEKTVSTLGSLVMLNSRILAVDEELKTIIERLEPGVHQFFLIEMRMPKGKVFPKKYYTLTIGQHFDAYSPEKSDESKKHMTGRAFFKDIFSKAHLWRDRRFPLVNCFSDELMAEISKAGLRLPKYYKMKEV